MIITVTLNPAIDVFIEVESLNHQKYLNIINKYKIAGGKGINISRVLNKLGEKTFVTGFNGGANGKFISKALSNEGIDYKFIKIDQETRENIKLYDQEHDASYEMNEAGPVVDVEYLDDLIILLKSIIKKNDILIISGSAPVNYDIDVYKILIQHMKPLCKMIALDTSKDWFKEGLIASPDLVKPNLEELERYTNKKLTNEKEMIIEAKKIIDLGVKEVLLSIGKQGSIYITHDVIYKVSVPDIEVKQAVGAGDALLAGFVSHKFKTNIKEALIEAAFMSLSYIAVEKDINAYKNQIEVKQINI